jgi:hypothetical protein
MQDCVVLVCEKSAVTVYEVRDVLLVPDVMVLPGQLVQLDASADAAVNSAKIKKVIHFRVVKFPPWEFVYGPHPFFAGPGAARFLRASAVLAHAKTTCDGFVGGVRYRTFGPSTASW